MFEILYIALLTVESFYLGFAVSAIKKHRWLAWILLTAIFAFQMYFLYTMVAPAISMYIISFLVSIVSTFVGFIYEKQRPGSKQQDSGE